MPWVCHGAYSQQRCLDWTTLGAALRALSGGLIPSPCLHASALLSRKLILEAYIYNLIFSVASWFSITRSDFIIMDRSAWPQMSLWSTSPSLVRTVRNLDFWGKKAFSDPELTISPFISDGLRLRALDSQPSHVILGYRLSQCELKVTIQWGL